MKSAVKTLIFTEVQNLTLVWIKGGVWEGGSTHHSTAIFCGAILYQYSDTKYHYFVKSIKILRGYYKQEGSSHAETS